MIRTVKEFSKQMVDAHDCEKCHGKIFAIEGDALGNTRCGYCHEIVCYPTATKEEMNEWMKNEEETKRIK
jgi:ribosomal protein L37AE/L43A